MLEIVNVECDNDETGKKLKNMWLRKGIRLEFRAPHIQRNVWYSNAGDQSWHQKLMVILVIR